MAKLYLKFETNTLKEIPVGQGTVVTIGRLPDNVLQIDNLAVSGHHSKIYWETDHYVVEDNKSLNGTYVNNQRVGKQPLKDSDSILIGKHTIVFKDEWHEDDAADKAKGVAMPALPKMEATVVLDTRKAKEMLAQAKAAASGMPLPAPASSSDAGHSTTPDAPATAATPALVPVSTASTPAAKHKLGTFTVLEGKTDESRYVLSGKLTVVGGSKMATIKLKGGFFKHPPDVAAMVSKREDKYFIAPQGQKSGVKVNGTDIAQMQELSEGDVVQVWNVKMAFAWHE